MLAPACHFDEHTHMEQHSTDLGVRRVSRRTRGWAVVALLVAAQRERGQAQLSGGVGRAISPVTSSVPPNSSSAFLLEALGGSAGSLAGIAFVGLTADCGVEDL